MFIANQPLNVEKQVLLFTQKIVSLRLPFSNFAAGIFAWFHGIYPYNILPSIMAKKWNLQYVDAY